MKATLLVTIMLCAALLLFAGCTQTVNTTQQPAAPSEQAAADAPAAAETTTDNNAPTEAAVEPVKEETDKAANKAPSFSGTSIKGGQISLEQFQEQEKPVVVYFAASWCSSCAKNWQALNEVYPEYKDKVGFVAISVDPTDTQKVLKALDEDKQFVFDFLPGDPQAAIAYDVKKQTAKFAVDKEGNIVSRHDGVLSADEWRNLFESLA